MAVFNYARKENRDNYELLKEKIKTFNDNNSEFNKFISAYQYMLSMEKELDNLRESNRFNNNKTI